MSEEIMTVQPDAAVEVVDIQFRPGQKVYYFDPAGMKLTAGDHVIMDTARGPEFGICTGGNHRIAQKDVVLPLRPVLRKANEWDERTVAENRETEKKAHDFCMKKITELALDMQLVSVECVFDGSKMLFFFTADERVDFRELVKTLATSFHTRIEMRQIGVRDKAKMVGGLDICGRPFCCAIFLDDFQPVSIKMAKTQNLSLNPTKISGTCGRLMCCLKYEQEAYEDLIKRSPKEESFVDTPEGRGTVIEVNLLRQKVKVRMEREENAIKTFAVEEIAVLRNGKAKKNDPPIPEDLAPISGVARKPRKVEEEAPAFLEPIKFRYSEEAVVEEPAPAVVEEEEVSATEEPAAKPGRSRNRNRRNRHKGEKKAENTEAKKPEKPVEEKKAEKPAAENSGEEKAKKPHHHRRRYHHRGKGQGKGQNQE